MGGRTREGQGGGRVSPPWVEGCRGGGGGTGVGWVLSCGCCPGFLGGYSLLLHPLPSPAAG